MKPINIPAIRGELGTLVYYTAIFTFKQVTERVRKIGDEIYTSKSLQEQLQRTLTDNYKKISDYILTQKEHFFNAIVLAVYDGDPIWNEVEIGFENQDYYNMGFLKLSGEEKIIPVDGQHRVEGIKEAIRKNKNLEDETISVIFIGHHNSFEGKQKTRRIFSTLNRYAKPVSLGDIIALDEDDIVAIVTRNLLETYPLFMNDKIQCDKKKSKALSESDISSFTSLITLYQCNIEIYRLYKQLTEGKNYTPSKIKETLRYRPEECTIADFTKFVTNFWEIFCQNLAGMEEFKKSNLPNPAEKYRNKSGGLLYFRPVALLPFIKAIVDVVIRSKNTIESVILTYSKVNMSIDKEPWVRTLWEPKTQTMIMINPKFAWELLIYMYDEKLLKKSELNDLIKKYAGSKDIEIKDVECKLKQLLKVSPHH